MQPNSEDIVQEIRDTFETMLTMIQASQKATADEMERTLFACLLHLGWQLLQLFFLIRTTAYPRTPLRQGEASLPYVTDKARGYYSIFGKLSILRPYFYKAGVGSASPLDAALSLGDDCYSDLVHELATDLGVEAAYEQVGGLFARWLGHSLSSQAVSKLVAQDAAYVAAYYAQKSAPAPAQEGTILVAESDGKGVPMVRTTPGAEKARLGKGEKRTQKKEAIVTSLYTIAAHPRTPAAVVASLFHPDQKANRPAATPPHPQHKQLWATLDGKDSALQHLAEQVAKREGPHIQQRMALTDGCEALQQRMQHFLPTFLLVLDFIHALEYLWQAANALFGEKDPQRTPWVETHALQILSGQTQPVIDTLRTLATASGSTATQQDALLRAAHYFQRNLPFMRYDHYLALGWPIASGVIEGACRHFVKDRFERSGMRWTQPGAEHLLRLRAVAENGDWADFQQFRKRQRHLFLYGSPYPAQATPEEQALDIPASPSGKVIPLPRPASSPSSPLQRKAA